MHMQRKGASPVYTKGHISRKDIIRNRSGPLIVEWFVLLFQSYEGFLFGSDPSLKWFSSDWFYLNFMEVHHLILHSQCLNFHSLKDDPTNIDEYIFWKIVFGNSLTITRQEMDSKGRGEDMQQWSQTQE